MLYQKKTTLNKCVFKSFAKVAGLTVRSLNSSGNSFQQPGPATAKALKPQSVLWLDTTRSPFWWIVEFSRSVKSASEEFFFQNRESYLYYFCLHREAFQNAKMSPDCSAPSKHLFFLQCDESVGFNGDLISCARYNISNEYSQLPTKDLHPIFFVFVIQLSRLAAGNITLQVIRHLKQFLLSG